MSCDCMSAAEKRETGSLSFRRRFWAVKKNRVLTLLTGIFLAVYFIFNGIAVQNNHSNTI